MQNLNDVVTMATPKAQNLRDYTVIAIIKIFRLAYFSLFLLHFLLFHFLLSLGLIINSLSVIFFSGGILLTYLSSLIYYTLSTFHREDIADQQKLEFIGTLVLIYIAIIPSMALQFHTQPSIQLRYLFAFIFIAIRNLVDFLVLDLDALVVYTRFLYHCVLLGVLALVLTIYALTKTFHSLSPLALKFTQLARSNSLSATFYLLRLLERIGIVNIQRPSLYIIYLILVYSMVIYSRGVL